jgi:hypothetical protein
MPKSKTTTGWHQRTSTSKERRARLRQKCEVEQGRVCLGRPATLQYPICASEPRLSCAPDPAGCRAAEHWARQYDARDVLERLAKPCNFSVKKPSLGQALRRRAAKALRRSRRAASKHGMSLRRRSELHRRKTPDA